MTRVVAPGSYDPVTVGHLDVFRRAAALFDEVVVAILHNPAKQGTFTAEERVSLIRDEVADLGNVRVEAFANRLVVDVCADLDAQVMIKGLRSETDFSYEWPMALMNRHLTRVETIFLPGDPRHEHISSSLVKEVARFGGDITGLVPKAVRTALLERLPRS
ncbi:pantetheine-phosphate adenylyltransferase [Janibacter anophelis]|uniref:pantetheine-phosphate adenylyltransferase n=1 Tax=Janibacter anophelis TaxID=319054 RepID=UPI00082C8919|nr:pantetheine-phosphate adenylyltransferase [Janibacter anophelis]